MMTILDYINETEKVCLDIVNRRKDITKSFLELVSDDKFEELVILGSGTSCHAALIAKPFMEKLFPFKVTAAFPTLYLDQNKTFPPHSLVIGLTQSGNSTSTKKALEVAKSCGSHTAALTANKASRILEHSDAFIELACGEELAVAKTKGYQASIVSLYVIALEWALQSHWITDLEYNKILDRLMDTILNMSKLIHQSETWYDRNKAELEKANHVMVLGCENQWGNVLEGTLKMVETVRIPVVGYEVEEFMHGIYNAINCSTSLIYVAHQSKTLNRTQKLHDYLMKKTEHQFIIGSKSLTGTTNKDCILDFKDDVDFCGLEYIIPFQVICHFLPPSKGINPFISGDPDFHAAMSSKVI